MNQHNVQHASKKNVLEKVRKSTEEEDDDGGGVSNNDDEGNEMEEWRKKT